MYGVDAKMSGEVWKLPAGMMSVAFGTEWRREEITNTPSPALQTGDISGYGGSFEAIDKDRDVFAIYGEALIPITKTLEFSAAVRYDDYSDVGNTTNPKFGLRWQPAKGFLARASYGTGFLAPSLQQLFLSQRTGVTARGHERSAALPDDQRHARLPHAVRRAVRRQPGAQAGRVDEHHRRASSGSRPTTSRSRSTTSTSRWRT